MTVKDLITELINHCDLNDDIRTLRQQLAELEKDAERYRWMRNNTSVMLFDQQTWTTSHKLDMRVDEAMKGSNDE